MQNNTPEYIPAQFKDFFYLEIPPNFWPLYEKLVEKDWNHFLIPDGYNKIVEDLKTRYPLDQLATDSDLQYTWIAVALFYRYNNNQYFISLKITEQLYSLLLEYQLTKDCWVHKGIPLVYIRDFHVLLNHKFISKRYAMLTLCEDSIGDYPRYTGLLKNERGIYQRLIFYHGMPEAEIDYYCKEIFSVYSGDVEKGRYPEWILQKIGNDWITENPESSELMFYYPNIHYIKYLYARLVDPNEKNKGYIFELLADHLLSAIPGFRTSIRKYSHSTDYDILCSLDGLNVDFRAELGRYLVCECKNWKKPANFTAIAKFCNVLESVKCKSGIIFSKNGISGKRNNKYAAREILKVFQRNGITVIVIDESDILSVVEGKNLINLIKAKYEKIRFDLE